MLNKKEYLLCVELHKELKRRITGKIFITINEGTLIVNIIAGKNMHYTRNINDIPRMVEIDNVADEIEYGYRRYINEQYFVKKEVEI